MKVYVDPTKAARGIWINNYGYEEGRLPLRLLSREEARELSKWRRSYRRRLELTLRDVYGEEQ